MVYQVLELLLQEPNLCYNNNMEYQYIMSYSTLSLKYSNLKYTRPANWADPVLPCDPFNPLCGPPPCINTGPQIVPCGPPCPPPCDDGGRGCEKKKCKKKKKCKCKKDCPPPVTVSNVPYYRSSYYQAPSVPFDPCNLPWTRNWPWIMNSWKGKYTSSE